MLVPIFNNHNQIIMYIGTSEEDEPSGSHRLLDGALFHNAVTTREASFSTDTRTWTERVHPDTQAALDRVQVLEAKEIVSTARLNTLTAENIAMKARLDRIDPPTPPGGP